MPKTPEEATSYPQDIVDKATKAIDAKIKTKGPRTQYLFFDGELRAACSLTNQHYLLPLIEEIIKIYKQANWHCWHNTDEDGSYLVFERPQ